ncbi:hypothetical protein H0H93_002554 [Arthromyces matolae]|nr:hypothetical protein H0H93_002554 [Arthromyces matolae]
MLCSLIVVVAALSTAVLASPVETRQAKCHPNFEGVGVSVLWNQYPFNTREWAPGAVGANITTVIDDFQRAAELRFEQAALTPGTYIAKYISLLPPSHLSLHSIKNILRKLGVLAINQVVSVDNASNYLKIAYSSLIDP